MRNRQQGISLLNFVLLLGMVVFVLYIAMKVVPMYLEYYSVRSALKGLSQESGIAHQAPAQIQASFMRRMEVNYSESIGPRNISFSRVGNGWKMDVNYEVRRPLIGNLDVVGKFHASQNLVPGGSAD